jgi:hypothetical protein
VRLPSLELEWGDVGETLLALAACDLDEVGDAASRLVAFHGATPVAVVTLRPFAAGEAVQALIEVLALVLPLGADRVAVGLPGRAWSLDAPPPVDEDGVDLRRRVMVVTTVDGTCSPPAVVDAAYPLVRDDVGEWGWERAMARSAEPAGEVGRSLEVLVAHRDDVEGSDGQLLEQFDRVLRLGHELALHPAAATFLELRREALASTN